MEWIGTLLLVEDEEVLRQLVAQFLRVAGFDVIEAGDGPEALERIEDAGPFDVALVDLNLPHLSGVEVCRSLRARWPDQAVIICSAAILPEHEAALRSMNINQFLTKPYHPEILLRQIEDRLHPAA